MGRLNTEKTKAFLDVVKANPDLPIVPIVSDDLVGECNVGEFGNATATSAAAHEQAEALDWQKAIVVYIYASEVDA